MSEEFSIAVKAFIIDDKDNLLLVKRSSDDSHAAGIWEIPGGRLDSEKESPFIGLKREIKEEVGLDIEIKNPLQVDHFIRQDGQNITMLIFLCKALSKDISLSDEHTDFKWVKSSHAVGQIVHFFDESVNNFIKFFRDKI